MINFMEYNYATSQAPDKGVQIGKEPIPTPNAIIAMTQGNGVQIGPEPIPTPNAIMAMTQGNISGFGGNLIEVGIVMNADKSATYTSKAYPANADGKQRPGAIVEYNSEFSVGEGLGGVPELPWGYIRAEFLESTGTQYINTNVVPDSTVEFDMKIAYPIPLKETKGYNVFFGCIGGDSYGSFRFAHSSYTSSRPDYAFIMETYYWFCYNADTIKARKIYRLQTALTPLSKTVPDVSMNETLMPYIITPNGTYSYTGPLITPIGLFCRIGFGTVQTKCSPFIVQSANLIKNGKSAFNAVGALDPAGVPCMYDRVTEQPVYNSGTGSFIVGFTLEQALQLSKLPKTGGSLQISLPWEAQLVQYNDNVEAALQTAKNKGWTITVQYRDPEADSTIYNKYAGCTTVDEMLAVNAEYRDDLTNDNSWVYLLPNLVDGRRLMSSSSSAGTKKLTSWAIPLPKVTNASDAFSGCSQLKYFSSELPVLVHAAGMFYGCDALIEVVLDLPKLRYAQLMFEYSDNFTRFKGQLPNLLRGDAMFLGTKLEIFDSYLPALTNGISMFYNCKLDKESALRVLTSIPTWTDGASHPITMGIHIDNQNDEEVLAAIDNATAKGWTVTTQWTGTPTNTASAFGMRRIWVRKMQDARGEYVDIDGTRWQVEWCDMLSTPDSSTPEDHGYELYRSVDAAVAYWELTPWVDPEQKEEFTQKL